MTAGNGDGLDGAGCTTETGRGVELGSVNTRPIAANSAQAQELIRALAELFPAVFIADGWKPHRPLKLGIHQVDRGVLLPDECHAVFRRYCSRLTYQKALASGGSRYGLDGELAGEVTPEQMAGGQSRVAAIEARRAL
jgi:sRNA-binding protein